MARKQIAVRLSEEEIKRVKVVAEADCLEHSVWIRRAIMLAVGAAEERAKEK